MPFHVTHIPDVEGGWIYLIEEAAKIRTFFYHLSSWTKDSVKKNQLVIYIVSIASDALEPSATATYIVTQWMLTLFWIYLSVI